MRIVVLSLVVVFLSSGLAFGITVQPGQKVDVGHGITVDNRQGNMPVEVQPESYFDPVTGDTIWVLHIEVDPNSNGKVIVIDENDQYQGPPGFQNDTAVDITDGRQPPDTELQGSGATHGNGDDQTTLPGNPAGRLKGINRVNGVGIGTPH
jgi:hypothetical protein